MTASFRDIPELRELEARGQLLRIPQEIDVPLTARVRQIIDTADFQRLSKISQLGLVSLVYPAARHTRFEHSLGVYRMTLLYLQKLQHDRRFLSLVPREEAEKLIVSALLHDLGHWPFCHPLEDLQLTGVPEHELFANSFLLEGEIADALRDDWKIQPREIVGVLSAKPRDDRARLLQSILSGPIDVDKMDYLMRDSLHAGVPYGRHFDQQRLIGSLCVNEAGDGLALTDKGRTAAEMMVFARYVMFSEVYWHHAVRSATAMFQRAFYLLYGSLDLDALFRLTQQEMIDEMQRHAGGAPAGELLQRIFGPRRQLYKRCLQLSFGDQRPLYDRLARRPYPWLVACAEALANLVSQRLARRVAPHEIMIDAPPVKLEVQFNVEILYEKEKRYRQLGQVSPVVHTLANHQFDNYVKRVRVFVAPELVTDMPPAAEFLDLLAAAVEHTEKGRAKAEDR